MAVANLTHPMAFFSQHLKTWVPLMCQTLRTHLAAFFGHAVAFTEAFLSVEMQGFDLVA
jgi:TorA maturation chaperone TorD